MPRQVCVIGAGVIGLSTAVVIQQTISDVIVTLIADKFSPDTTGDGAAGFWMPHALGKETPDELIRKWAKATWDHITELYIGEDGVAAGTQLLSGYELSKDLDTTDSYKYKDMVLGAREMNERELAMFPGTDRGLTYTTYMLECHTYLPWLLNRFVKQGGIVQQRYLKSLEEVSDKFSVVVNCTGLGARELAGDDSIEPIRGEVIRVDAPWLKHFVIQAPCVIFPGAKDVVLGGTHDYGDWNVLSDPLDRQRILREATAAIPSLKNARIKRSWVGLRPFRPKLRLEREVKQTGGRPVQVIHNYGHSGSGVSLHWGCAQDAAGLVQEALQDLCDKSKL